MSHRREKRGRQRARKNIDGSIDGYAEFVEIEDKRTSADEIAKLEAIQPGLGVRAFEDDLEESKQVREQRKALLPHLMDMDRSAELRRLRSPYLAMGVLVLVAALGAGIALLGFLPLALAFVGGSAFTFVASVLKVNQPRSAVTEHEQSQKQTLPNTNPDDKKEKLPTSQNP